MAEEEKQEETMDFGRSNLYEEYISKNAQPPVEEKKEEPEPEKKAEAAPVVAEPEKKEEPSPEPEKKEEKEQKMVPLDALHQEREKRKSAQKKISELENQLKAISAKFEEQTKPPEEIENYENAIRDLRNELKTVRSELSNYRNLSEQERRKIQEEKVATLIDTVDKELEAEGFPLFRRFQNVVGEEIMKRVAAEPDQLDKEALMKELDTPLGWKRIYKESIFPDLEKHMDRKKKVETKQEKIELKKAAQLGGGSNAQPEEKDKEKTEWTSDDYLAERRKTDLGAQIRRV